MGIAYAAVVGRTCGDTAYATQRQGYDSRPSIDLRTRVRFGCTGYGDTARVVMSPSSRRLLAGKYGCHPLKGWCGAAVGRVGGGKCLGGRENGKK